MQFHSQTGGMFLLCRPASADTRSALVTTATFFVGAFGLTLATRRPVTALATHLGHGHMGRR